MVAMVVLDVGSAGTTSGLVIVEKDDHIVIVLYNWDIERNPNVQLLLEGSQDRHIRFSSDFSTDTTFALSNISYQLSNFWISHHT